MRLIGLFSLGDCAEDDEDHESEGAQSFGEEGR